MDGLLGVLIVSQLLVLSSRASVKLVQLLNRSGLKTSSASRVLLESLGRKHGRLMVDGSNSVHLMNWHRGVHSGGLINIFLDDGLDVLMDVVVNVLAGHDRSLGCRVVGLMSYRGIGVLGLILGQRSLQLLVVAVVKRPLFDSQSSSCVLSGTTGLVSMLIQGDELQFGSRNLRCLLSLDGLDSCLVMMLMDLAVYSSRNLLMLLRVDVLFSNGLANILVDDGLVLAPVGEKVGNCLLSLLHVVGY